MSDTPAIRLVVVDDQEMYREGFRLLLDSRPDIEIVGDADNGARALDLLERVEADVVLMDVRMPDMDGVTATERITAGGGPRVLMLTTFDLDEHAYDAIAAGASGFLLKDTSLDELVAAIKHVHAGQSVIAPSTTRRMLDHLAQARPVEDTAHDVEAERAAVLAAVTAREREVLDLIAEGLSNAEIAEHLVIAESTVRVHVGRILTKLDLRDRVQAVVLAHRLGLGRSTT